MEALTKWKKRTINNSEAYSIRDNETSFSRGEWLSLIEQALIYHRNIYLI
jgi:hypothetical protein